jgi:polysaccharide export outer membrane protein
MAQACPNASAPSFDSWCVMTLDRTLLSALLAASIIARGQVLKQPDYLLQPEDEITVHSLEAKEIADKTFRLDQHGETNFPLIGRVSLAGNSIPRAEDILTNKLKKYYVEPDVELSVAVTHTEPVSVIGSVGVPGMHPIKGRTTLIEELSAAGGIKPDAGPTAIITRDAAYGTIPTAGAHINENGEVIAEVNLKDLLDARDPKLNFVIQPHDVISIPQAQLVYVEGNVKHAGGFTLSGRPDLSVLQVLALAEGLDPRAAPQHAHILRRNGESKQLIAVDLKRIMQGKSEDVVMRPNDVLFIPNSAAKVITTRTVEAAIAIGSGLLIFH